MGVTVYLELVGVPAGGCFAEGVHRVLGRDGVHDLAVVVGAAGKSRCFHTYRTHDRSWLFLRASGGFVAERSSGVMRANIEVAVLGGEPAVPCTRNPLQRG